MTPEVDLEQVELVENSRTQNTTKNELWMVFVVVVIVMIAKKFVTHVRVVHVTHGS